MAPRSLLLLLLAAACVLALADDALFRVLRSVDDVVATVETRRHVSAVLLLSSQSDAKLQELTAQNGGAVDDAALAKALEAQFPHMRKILQSLDGAVDLVVADIPDAKQISKKWNVATLPALVVYKDAPKKNPYTGKMYRDAALTPLAVLQQPRELKRLLRDSIPATYVTEWTAANGYASLDDAKRKLSAAGALVVLVSKQPSASPLFRALSVEFESRGLAFAYVHRDEAIAEEIVEQWGIDKLPAIVVVKKPATLEDREVFQDDAKMKTFADLKSLVEPFATSEDEEPTKKDTASSKTASDVPLLTSETFDDLVLQSKLTWIVSFLDAATEASLDKKAWQKTMSDIQKKAGIVALGAVSCEKDVSLCEKYGVGKGGVVRIFPVHQNPSSGEIERSDVLAETFKTVDDAREAAIAAIPDLVQVMGSSAELNAFVARALAAKAMPVLLVTSKLQTPTILKSLALSFPTQNIAVGVVSDLDPQVKQQFNLPASAKSSLLCLVAVDKQTQVENQPANTAPFGIILYDKKLLGPLTYANMVRFLMSVLAQHPHPKPLPQADDGETGLESGVSDDTAAPADVPYLRQDNLDALCSGNKICAIGFFEGHVDTLGDAESPLAKAVGVLSTVAAKSRKSRQPFQFMWTNGKCQSSFAESFGVGAFQMPTIVVYSPSKSRYATNIGVFDEENTSGFLKGVLSGKIVTSPLKDVGALRAECSVDEVTDAAAAVPLEDETDEDLGDLLSEILGDEEQQRRQLQEELAKERKAAKKQDKSGSKSKKDKKKKKKKGKKKGDERDEL